MSYISFQATQSGAPAPGTTRIVIRRTADDQVIADTALGTVVSLGQGFFRTSVRVLESVEYSVFTGAGGDQPITGLQNRFHVGQDGVVTNTRRVVVTNQIADTGAPIELYNYAGQGNAYPNYPVASVVVHNYTDSEGMRIDQVGSGALLRLRNAQNQVHRPGLAVGTGEFLVFDEENYNGGSPVFAKLFTAYKSGTELVFNAVGNIPAGATRGLSWAFVNNRPATSADFAFVFSCTSGSNPYLMKWRNTGNDVCYIENSSNEGRFYSSGGMTSGLRLGSTVGPVKLSPATGQEAQVLRQGTLYPIAPIMVGTTANRPATQLVAGLPYFDTTLGKPIWYNGSAWKDADGVTV